jgi:hypothetical protein
MGASLQQNIRKQGAEGKEALGNLGAASILWHPFFDETTPRLEGATD